VFSNPSKRAALSGKPPIRRLTGLSDRLWQKQKQSPPLLTALLPQPILKGAQNGLEQALTPYPT